MAAKYLFVRPALDVEGNPKLVPSRPLGVLRRTEADQWPKGAVAPTGERLQLDRYVKSLIRSGDLVEVAEPKMKAKKSGKGPAGEQRPVMALKGEV